MSVSFASLGVDERIITGLKSQGITDPLPIQAITLKDALQGRDICGKADTGSGKTLAFGIALLQQDEKGQPRNPRSLVLVPTRELAVQVSEVLHSVSGPSEVIVRVVYGGVSIETQIRALRRGVDILVATPGRLIDLVNRRAVSLARITSVVLDEADRMADMGFMPQVREILDKTFPDRQTMLFSATLDGDVDQLVKRYMTDPVRHEVASVKSDTSKMTQYFLSVGERDKVEAVSNLVQGADRALIFVRTKRGAEEITNRLISYGIRASSMHGDLRQSARNRVLERFSRGSLRVVVATDVAARGLDVSGLDLVVHFDLPDDHKSYIHRSGRTARGGASGVVVTVLTPKQGREVRYLQNNLGVEVPIFSVDPSDSRLGLLVKASEENELIEFEEILHIGAKASSPKARPASASKRRGYSGRNGESSSFGPARRRKPYRSDESSSGGNRTDRVAKSRKELVRDGRITEKSSYRPRKRSYQR